ncbi:MAG: hypothetical protein H7343_10195 [Undibacterium sp.]|nr:hypothetical protein [Opitutaceae bacterium]
MSLRHNLALGVVGTFGAFTLGEINHVVGILAGLATVAWMTTQTVLAIRAARK